MQLPTAQVVQQIAGGSHADIELHLGVLGVVLLQQLGGGLHVGVDDPQLQLAPGPGLHVPHAVRHGPQALEHLPAVLVEAPARLGEGHPFVGAQEQGHPQLVLQQGQLAADGGLGHMERPGRSGDAPLLRHGGEIFQLLEVHRRPPYFFYIANI